MDIFFELDKFKKSCLLRKSAFVIYSPKTVTIDPANSIKLDTNVLFYIYQKKQRHT